MNFNIIKYISVLIVSLFIIENIFATVSINKLVLRQIISSNIENKKLELINISTNIMIENCDNVIDIIKYSTNKVEMKKIYFDTTKHNEKTVLNNENH